VEGHGRANAGLLSIRRNYGNLSDSGKAASSSPQPSSMNAIVVGQKNFQGVASQISLVGR
jgi:hypothetical protein